MITRRESARSFLVTGRTTLPSELSCQALAARLFKRRHGKNGNGVISRELVQQNIRQRCIVGISRHRIHRFL